MGKKEKGQFYSVIVLAIIVLVISVWAFIQGIQEPVGGKITQKTMSGEQGSAVRETDNQSKEIDTAKLAEEALKQITFDTELTQMEDSVVESMITTAEEDTEVILYMGEGTCADELMIVKVQDEKNIDSEIKSVQQHLSDMQQSFQDYLPKEAKKIDDTVILQREKYIVVCVTADADNAKNVIEVLLK